MRCKGDNACEHSWQWKRLYPHFPTFSLDQYPEGLGLPFIAEWLRGSTLWDPRCSSRLSLPTLHTHPGNLTLPLYINEPPNCFISDKTASHLVDSSISMACKPLKLSPPDWTHSSSSLLLVWEITQWGNTASPVIHPETWAPSSVPCYSSHSSINHQVLKIFLL